MSEPTPDGLALHFEFVKFQKGSLQENRTKMERQMLKSQSVKYNVFYVCILCMYSMYVLYVCIQYAYSMCVFYVFYVCTMCVFYVCILYMYSIHVFYGHSVEQQGPFGPNN